MRSVFAIQFRVPDRELPVEVELVLRVVYSRLGWT